MPLNAGFGLHARQLLEKPRRNVLRLSDLATRHPIIQRTKRGADKAEEFRIAGKLYMIKVSPKQDAPYYLVDDKGNGSFARSDKADIAKQVPPWVFSQFYCPTY